MLKIHSDEGPPCRNMEALLQGVADGSLKGIRKWYAVAHATRCSHCGTFLARLRETLELLRAAKSVAPPPADAMERMKRGAWAEVTTDGDES